MNRPRRCTRIGCVRWYWKLLDCYGVERLPTKVHIAGECFGALRRQMVDVVENAQGEAPAEAKPRRPLPSWVITVGSLVVLLGAWEILGRDINPVFGSYPSAIAEAFWQLARTGKLWSALLASLRPFLLGYGLAIVVGIPIGLVTGRFRAVEAAIGIYITAGYAMPLVALVPLLVLWLGLGFAVKVAVVFLMSVFP